jgi:hypothetical protein
VIYAIDSRFTLLFEGSGRFLGRYQYLNFPIRDLALYVEQGVITMEDLKRRQFERKHSQNLIDYVEMDYEGKPAHRYMGRTLNVSEGGILLETYKPLTEGQIVIITIAIDEEMVALKGRVIHVKKTAESLFHSGIDFLKINEYGKRVLQWYIEASRNARSSEDA